MSSQRLLQITRAGVGHCASHRHSVNITQAAKKTLLSGVSALQDTDFIKKALRRKFVDYLLKEELGKDVYIGMRVLEDSLRDSPDKMTSEKKKTQLRSNLITIAQGVDYHSLVAKDLKESHFDLLEIVGSVYKDVAAVTTYLFQSPGKRFRPTLHVIVNKILESHFDANPTDVSEARVLQAKLIEAIELIHVASLMHDDVLDSADTRRNMAAAHEVFGNKKSILGGDFLLARACRIVANFGVPEVLGRTAASLENLVKGEMVQSEVLSKTSLEAMFREHLTKTYLKTASLMSETCASGAILGGFAKPAQQWAFELGTAVGMAFQINDDIIDFTQSAEKLGKPAMNDARKGIITAPLIFAAVEHPQIVNSMLGKPLDGWEDEEAIRKCVLDSCALPSAKLAALFYLNRVTELLELLPMRDGGLNVHCRALIALLCDTLKGTLNDTL